MSEGRVIIAGGGIGGLGAALMLAQKGVEVTVLERAPEFKEVGAGLQLAPNVTRVLDEVGVLERILPLAVQPRRVLFMSAATGEELTHLDLLDARARYGGPYIVLHRSDLLDALVAAAREHPGIELRTDHKVTALDDRGDHVVVTATHADGTTTELTASLLVGADGLHSVVRTHIHTDEVVCSGYVAYRGAVPVENVDSRASMDDVVVWMGPGLHLVQYPVRAGRLYNQVAVFRSRQYLDGAEEWGTPDELDATYEGMSEPVRAAIPALQRIARWPMYDRLPLDAWTKGRVTLLGDAAHPMLQYLAQGAGQALLDGAALAASLAPLAGAGTGSSDWSDADVAAALGRYEDVRVAAAGRVQSTARVWGDIWHVDEPVAQMLRDETFRSRDVHDYHLVDWLYGPVVDTADDATDAVPSTPAALVTDDPTHLVHA